MDTNDEKDKILFNGLAEIFWSSRRAGKWCRLSLETTRTGEFITHLSVKHSSDTGGLPGTGRKTTSRPSRSTPSRVRRNFQRRQEFLAKKEAEAAAASSTESVNDTDKELVGEDIPVTRPASSSQAVPENAVTAVENKQVETIMQIDGNTSLSEIEEIEEPPVKKNCWKSWGEETVLCWKKGSELLPSNADLDFVWRQPKCRAIDIRKVAENRLQVTLSMGEGYTWDNYLCKSENWPRNCVYLERVLGT